MELGVYEFKIPFPHPSAYVVFENAMIWNLDILSAQNIALWKSIT